MFEKNDIVLYEAAGGKFLPGVVIGESRGFDGKPHTEFWYWVPDGLSTNPEGFHGIGDNGCLTKIGSLNDFGIEWEDPTKRKYV